MKGSENWLGSVSDMMSGLMMVFLLISIAFMLEMQQQRDDARKYQERVQEITATFTRVQVKLYLDLDKEFRNDFPKWRAELLQDSTVRFHEPEVLFAPGRADLQERFKVILDDFFPRYLAVLTRPEYASEVEELRIEGHTSSSWENAVDLRARYLNNAELSQERALAVVRYVFSLDSVAPKREWLVKSLRANGLSFARPMPDGDHEDAQQSRRVEFRVLTGVRERLFRVIEVGEEIPPAEN